MPSLQLDDERQRLVEQLAEAERELEERKREEGEEKRRLQSLVADCERKSREQSDTIEEVKVQCMCRVCMCVEFCNLHDFFRRGGGTLFSICIQLLSFHTQHLCLSTYPT